MTLPLAGLTVVDLTSVIMGPYATQILADLGADVITVEEPGGTLSRVMTPGPHAQLSGIALNLLRNKRNVVFDLKQPAGRAALLRLIETSDVFVTNLRPAAISRLGLDYHDLTALRADIIYCQAQGWPSDSADANRPAYDDIIQAATGVADAGLRANGSAQFAPTILADKVCGLTIAYAVMAAVIHRDRTGQGQHVEVPMVDVMSSFMLVEHGAGAIGLPPQTPAGYQRILNSERRPQRALDGWVSVLPYSRQNYQDLFRAGGRADLEDDERIASARSRVRHAASLYRDVAEIVAKETAAHWLDFCARTGIPATPVASLDDLVDALPVQTHPVAGPYRVTAQPVRFTAATTEPTVRRPAALSGEHTSEVLTELGFDASMIEAVIEEATQPSRGRKPQPAQKENT
ncbi:CaiB/BaiF CoA transferase family protein [Nocardia vaccinii]|uniref:CaiB/BaiF CoA transferase family protein n=1 Tax=Nocardia vaccinii TaxID=1822 RepID=UPI000835482F|nr:CoA transferase [Nocardia vaccinii]